LPPSSAEVKIGGAIPPLLHISSWCDLSFTFSIVENITDTNMRRGLTKQLFSGYVLIQRKCGSKSHESPTNQKSSKLKYALTKVTCTVRVHKRQI
jgi:hypothetical protein